MAQVTIYLDAESERQVKRAAEAAGVSVSRWIAEAIAQRARAKWPDSVHELRGAWADLERPADTAADIPRESL
jgi:predicted transcriptional regulator